MYLFYGFRNIQARRNEREMPDHAQNGSMLRDEMWATFLRLVGHSDWDPRSPDPGRWRCPQKGSCDLGPINAARVKGIINTKNTNTRQI